MDCVCSTLQVDHNLRSVDNRGGGGGGKDSRYASKRSPEEILSVFRRTTCWLVMWPLDDAATSGLFRTFGRNGTQIQRLTSVSSKVCRGTEGVSLR